MIRTHRPRARLARAVAGLAVGSVALAASPLAGVASADGHLGEPIPTDAVCVNMPAGYQPFTDIAADTFRFDIRCLRFGGVARGVTETAYAPGNTITRDQMASLVARMMDTAKALEVEPGVIRALPASASGRFVDLDPNSPHTSAINRLAAAGVVSGGPGALPDNRFAPGQTVTRAQMATFVANAVRYLLDEELEAFDDHFDDDDGSVHEPNINLVAELGIAVGRKGSWNFGVRESLPRGQMAAFIARTLALLEYSDDEFDSLINPLVAPPAG